MVTLLVRVEDVEEGRAEQFAFIRSPVRIGRGELNDLPLARQFVSTYHGLVQFDDDQARYVDLGSTNGSILDGVALESNVFAVLGPGAELTIGTFRLTFELRTGVEESIAPRPVTAFALRSASELPAGDDAARGAAARAPSGAADAPPPLDARAEAEASRAIEAASMDLDLQYASYRGAWEYMRSALQGALGSLDPAARAVALNRLGERYPQLRAEPQFVELLGSEAVAAAAARGAGAARAQGGRAAAAEKDEGGGAALRLLRTFAESYLPRAPRLTTSEEIEHVLGRIADALETFGRSFLELQRGYEEFGKEMGVRTVPVEGPLQRARDVRQLLAYVLDARAQGRSAELQRAFADFMIHQVALLRGVQEGAKALLAQLSPETIASGASGKWPMRAAAQWKAFEDRYREIAEDDAVVADLLFGAEFAKAYASLAGQQGDPPEWDEASGDEAEDEVTEARDEDARPAPTPSRGRPRRRT